MLEYYITFRVYDPTARSEANARLSIWARNQRHADMVAKYIYPGLGKNAGYDVSPVTGFEDRS